MPFEIELKFPLTRDVMHRLIKLNPLRVTGCLIASDVFMKNNNIEIRLRKIRDMYTVTYKDQFGNIDDYAKELELQIQADKPEDIVDFFMCLGFAPLAGKIKQFETFKHNKILITLSTILEKKRLNNRKEILSFFNKKPEQKKEFKFIELEIIEKNVENIDTDRQTLVSFARQLGMDPSQALKSSYFNL